MTEGAAGSPASGMEGKVDNIVVVYYENEPFDRVFPDFPGADGDRSQQPAPAHDGPLGVMPWEPTHGTPSWRFRGLWANRFFRGKLGPKDHPIFWEAAKEFTLADRHRTQEGPSTGNHRVIFAGTSDGLYNNPKSWWNPGRWLQWVFGGPALDKEGPSNAVTLEERMDHKGVTWGVYGEQDIDMFSRLIDPKTGHARNSHSTDQFFADVAAGNMPQVSFVYSDAVPAQDDIPGDALLGRVADAVNKAGKWKNTAILATWDDWGGKYDHVKPNAAEGPAGFHQGGRVALNIISPYARKSVFHEPTTHASFSALITKRFGLEPGPYDATANDLTHAFDLNQAPLPPLSVTDPAKVDVAALEEMITAPPPQRSLIRRMFGVGAKAASPATAVAAPEATSAAVILATPGTLVTAAPQLTTVAPGTVVTATTSSVVTGRSAPSTPTALS